MVRASGTSLTGLFGVGPVVAAIVAGDASRRDTVPEPRSLRRLERDRAGRGVLGGRKIDRLSLRGNRRVKRAIDIAAVTEIRYKHSRAAPTTTRSVRCGFGGRLAVRGEGTEQDVLPAALIEPDDAHGNLVALRGLRGYQGHTAAGGVHHIHAELSPGARVRAAPGRKIAMPVSPALPHCLPPPAACQH